MPPSAFKIPYHLKTSNILDDHPDIFNWLELQDYNVNFILIVMLIVVLINVVSVLLILILERTNMVGILKALGGTNKSIQSIFIYMGLYIVLIGLIIGDTLAMLTGFIQNKFQLLTLNPESYYIDHVPYNFDLMGFMLINAATILIALLVLIIPSLMIKKNKHGKGN